MKYRGTERSHGRQTPKNSGHSPPPADSNSTCLPWVQSFRNPNSTLEQAFSDPGLLIRVSHSSFLSFRMEYQ